MDKVRQTLVTAVTAKGSSLREASIKIGRNASYLHQFVNYEKPSVLPEADRLKLAKFLGVDETTLRQAVSRTAPRGNSLIVTPRTPDEVYDQAVAALEAAITERGLELRPSERNEFVNSFLSQMKKRDT